MEQFNAAETSRSRKILIHKALVRVTPVPAFLIETLKAYLHGQFIILQTAVLL